MRIYKFQEYVWKYQCYKNFDRCKLRMIPISQSSRIGLSFWGRPRDSPRDEPQKVLHSGGSSLNDNIKIGWKGLSETNTLVYQEN